MSKRRRLLQHRIVPAPVPSLDTSTGLHLQALVCVRVVCRNGPEALRLPHVVASLHELLDWSRKLTLVWACGANMLHMARRLVSKDAAEPAESSRRDPRFRQWQFSEGVAKAVAAGNSALVELLAAHFTECSVPRSAAAEAARFGRLEILQWLVSRFDGIEWNGIEVLFALQGNHLEMAKWLRGGMSGEAIEHAEDFWAAVAAQNGNLEALEWVCSLPGETKLWRALAGAVDNGHLETAKWIVQELGGDFFKSDETILHLDKAVLHGHFDVLEWIVSYCPQNCRASLGDSDAARNGRLDILRLLRANGICDDGQYAMSSAASSGHLDIVKWLHNELKDAPPGCAIDAAATNGHFEVAKWLHENTSERCTIDAMNGAAENGDLDIVQWLHENRSEGCSAYAMDTAASKGNLEMVKWLSENRTEGCTTRAMNLAASQGHLDVVKWLHDNRQEGCTTDAMNFAAMNGKLDVVKWLHENRTEGCTTIAMDGAAGNGYLEVVKWLHANRSEGCTTLAMDVAAQNNWLEVVWFLDAQRAEGCTPAAMDEAAAHGHMEMLQWVEYLRTEGCTALAVEEAVLKGYYDIALYLHRERDECDVIQALRNCPIRKQRWAFMDWMCLYYQEEFETTIARQLLAD